MLRHLLALIWGILHSCMLLGLLFLLYQYALGMGLSYAFNGPIQIDWLSNIILLAFVGVVLVLFHVLSARLLIYLQLLDQRDKYRWGSILGLFWACLFSLLIGSLLFSFSQSPLPAGRLDSVWFIAIICSIWLCDAMLKYWIVSKRLYIRAYIGLIWWLCCFLLLVGISTQVQDIQLLGLISVIEFGIFQTGLLWYLLRDGKSAALQEQVV